MKIERNTSVVELSSLKYGDCFDYNYSLYVKVQPLITDKHEKNGYCLVLNMNENQMYLFDKSANVKPVNVTVYVNDDED